MDKKEEKKGMEELKEEVRLIKTCLSSGGSGSDLNRKVYRKEEREK